MNSLKALPLFSVTALLAASTAAQAGNVITDSQARAALYDSLYPYSAEYCGHSQIRMKPGFGATIVGGQWGHATIYLKGACRDMSRGFPGVALCDELPPGPDTAEGGVGVSTDYDYENVNWTATPSRQFFYWGALKPGERITPETYNRTMSQAREMGLLTGTTSWDKIFKDKPEGMSREEFRWQDVFGTDFAVNFGRASACVRVPMNRDQIRKIVEFLNEENRSARENGNPWEGFSNNCSHSTHNSLAAAGFWGRLAVNRSVPVQLFNLAIPYNEFVQAMEQGNTLPLENPIELFKNRELRKTFLEENWLPTQHGVVAEFFPAYPENDLYDTTTAPNMIDLPGLEPVHGRFEAFTSKPGFTKLKANLLRYRARYRKILEHKAAKYWYLALPKPSPSFDYVEFGHFFDRYYAWVEAQLQDVERKLQKLN